MMKKSKSGSSSSHRDRLSELPESLIFHIFWFLPMKAVVRTSLLSNRWKNLWTTAPFLNFDKYDDSIAIRNFVNRALFSWRGIRIQKFMLNFYDPDLFDSDFDLWMRFAVDKKVEELYVYRNPMSYAYYLAPQHLYSHSSLKVLGLEGCQLDIHGNVQWNRLKSLTIDNASVDNFGNMVEQVLISSPQLEVLSLTMRGKQERLSIRSHSLKKLSIVNYAVSDFYYDQYPYQPSFVELGISTPNLETLEIAGCPYYKSSLMDVMTSLNHATLGFFHHDYYKEKENNVLWGTMKEILPTIKHVERVTLTDWCIKVLADMKKACALSPLPNVWFLKVHASFVEYEQIANLLEIFPNLKMLVIQDKEVIEYVVSIEPFKFEVKSCLKFEANLPKSFLQQLRTVEITWAEGDESIFSFVEMVLKYASKLEKMVIQVIPTQGMMPPPDSMFLASQKLLGMPRSSPNCRVNVL